MFYTLSAIAILVAGHFFCALLVYLNHRFIFHTKIGNISIFKGVKKLHSMHHAHAYNEQRNNYIYVPVAWKLFLIMIVALIGILINLWFAVGIASFAMLYTYRHYAIHNGDKRSRFFNHHKIHHINPKYNLSGIYPFIDTLFKTSLNKKS